MQRSLNIVGVFIFCISLLHAAPAAVQTLEHDGLCRRFLIRLPSHLPARPMPLLIALHGAGGTSTGMEQLSKFSEYVDRHEFAVVFPNGENKIWNDGRGYSQVDDVGFILALIKEVSSQVSIDATRIFVSGFSNGGMMAFRLASEASSTFAGLATVGSNLPENLLSSFGHSKNFRVVMINGEDDPIVPYAGGRIEKPGSVALDGEILSFPETHRYWVQRLGLRFAPYNITYIHGVDGTLAQIANRSNEGNILQSILIKGAGHTWPGGIQYLPESKIGKTSTAIDGTKVILHFLGFQRDSKK
jgi:polyhydroxybutyrate depolymerase